MVIAACVMVHGLADARMALAPGRPVTLLSAPGAVLFGGCLWWRELMRAAGAEFSLLDCADAPGRAVEALRLGQPGLILNCEAGPYDAVAGIAAAQGAVLLRAAPPALDLAEPGATRRLAAWLGG